MALTEDEVGEVRALKDLLESDGWTLFERMIHRAWGPEATLTMVQDSIGKYAFGASPDAIQDSAQHVLAKQAAVLDMLNAPKARLRDLTGTAEKAGGMFEKLRRGPGR